jgi:hypothetical protein
VQADDVLHGAGKKPKGIGVAQIALHGKRQLGDVFERANVLGTRPRSSMRERKSFDLLPGARNHGLQSLQLQLAQLRSGV